MAYPVLEIKNVTKTFGSLVAVKNLSLTVRPGEIYGLIGPNGSGKTTTLKMVAGLYRPTVGTIRIQDHDLSESPTRAKEHLGYVPDDPSAYDRLTGREFLQFVGELFGMDRKVRDERIERLLGEYGLHEMADSLHGGYSRGTKQKISVIAALLHEPELIVIDEPMVGLDPASIAVTKRLFRAFAEKGGAILISTHTLQVAEDLCDRFGVLKGGKLVVEGKREKLLKKAGLESGTLEDIYMSLT